MAGLQLDRVTREYETRAEPLVVLKDVSMSLDPGENVAILGPSGSGKSTLLHIMGAIDQPTSGRVEINGQSPFSLSEPELAAFRNQHVGFIFQEHHLLPQLSVFENVLIPCVALGNPSKSMAERARDLVARVGLTDRMEHRPAELSGGERQRAAVARALICSPVLLLADEPTGSLDRTNALEITRLLLELQGQEDTMLVMVTHSLDLAGHLSRRLVLDDGCLVTDQ